jgi:predicted solute-binding protein
MWMARADAVAMVSEVDFAGARDEGLEQVEKILSECETDVPLPRSEIRKYLTENITFQLDDDLENGMRLYFELARKHRLIENNKPLLFIAS